MKKSSLKRLAIFTPLLVLLVSVGLMQRKPGPAATPDQSKDGAMPQSSVTVKRPGPGEAAAPGGEPAKTALAEVTVPGSEARTAALPGAWTTLFRTSGPTTGQPLEPKSAAYAQALLEGKKPSGRVTPLDSASFSVLGQMQKGDKIRIPLTDREAVEGTVNLVMRGANGSVSIGGTLPGTKGTFVFDAQGDKLSGSIQFPEKAVAFAIEKDAVSGAVSKEVLLSDLICFGIPKAAEAPLAEPQNGPPAPPPASIPILNSRPGAVAQLYLDFDGETVTDTFWNGGVTIVAEPSNLSEAAITEVFDRVKEDFMSFNVNVTTDLARFNSAPLGKRMNCIITPTNWRGSGGVAQLFSFQRTDRTVSCWVFNTDVGGAAEAVSHELGHTFGLSHDGRLVPAEEYFEGHGSGATSWAPIMGVGYYQNVTQWSKGEYASATNLQDDVAIISNAANGVGYVPDEAGGTQGTAAPLSVVGTAVSHVGVITSAADTDFFSFTTSGGAVTISVTLGMPSPNLDVALELLDESGNVVAANSPAGSLSATLSATPGAGSYYVKIAGAGAGDPVTSGYSTYGSIGGYTLTGTINGFQPTAEIVVESPSGTEISSGGSKAFGVVQVGSSGDIDFTIKNVGLAPLILLSDPRVYASGSADFQVIAQPASGSIPPNGSASFTVRFSPTSSGTITGLLDILHNDPSGNENGFHIHLTGTGSNNVAPSDITLSPASIAENSVANATVGTLSATDANSGDTHSYSLVSGAGSADNASFAIVGNQLTLAPSANFEARSSYAVRLQASDSGIGNLSFEKALTVTITNVNEVPSFTKGADQTVANTATSLRTITSWATAINDGDSTVVQSLAFDITGNSNPGIFSTQPAVSSGGTLTFTPNGTLGTSTLSVTLTDDSSINGTPALTSATQTFTITVQPPGTGAPDFMDANVGGGFYVNSSVMQPDGKVIVAGYFESVLGTPRNSIARLNTDGSLDMGFNPNANSAIWGAAMQPDGKIVVVGFFSSIGGAARNGIARLNPDGTADTSFNAGVSGGFVNCMAVQGDGKILLGGTFKKLGAADRLGIARLNSNGTLDSGFSASFSGGDVDTIAVQADGQILAGGRFTAVGGSPRNYLARLGANGALDATFNPSAGDSVSVLTVLPDGKILVGGNFLSLGGSPRNFLGRLTSAGTLDTAFVPNVNSSILTMALQADGKIFIGGPFSVVNGTGIVGLARLHSDGTRDTGFPPSVNGTVYGVTCQPDGKLLVGGGFTSVNNTPRSMFARLVNDAPAQALSVPDGSQVLWTRGGAAPEVEQVTFERSLNNGVTWTPLGYGVRVGTTGSWQLPGLALTGTGQIRALGRSVGGYNRSSSSVVEMTAGYSFAPAPLPIVSAVTPASGGTIGGTSVTITGSNFAPALGVSFGGTPATSFTVLNATTITATTPSHAAGAVDVSVSTSDNTGTGSGLFTYVAQPEIVVEQPLATGLTDGTSATAFGSVGVSLTGEARVYTIRNIGNGDLTGLVVTRTGSSDFVLNTSVTAASLAPGASTTFSVSFSPASSGAKTGAITIASNDSDENPFDISLTGTGVILATGVNFIETFANNGAGWTLDTGWAIGSATAGTNDPALDHSPDANNGIAGYVIGGGTGTAIFAPRYLTSPVINTNVAGSVFLEFHRWLNADFPPYQMSTVAVWNGSAWIQLYAVPANVTVADSSWTLAQYDVTAHKNPDFRIRFSVENGPDAFESGSWNIDDLRVYDQTPDIAVEQPVGTSLTDGTATSAFGSVNGGSSSAAKVYTVSNGGTATLSGIAVTSTGSGDFVLNTTGLATSLAPGATTTFSVTFTPTSGGTKTASLAIASNDPGENPFDIALTGVGLVNSAPSDITLSPAAIAENNAPAATVGVLAATDVDVADTHSFAFAGGADDAAFAITGNQLKINASADYETKSSYTVRVRATDSGTGNLTFEKTLTVAITNVNEAPSISAPASLAINEDVGTGALAFTVSDPDAGAVLTVTAVSSNLTLVPANAIVLAGSGANRSVTLTPAAGLSGGSTITLMVSDGALTAQGSLVLTVNPVNDVPAFAKGGDQTHPFGTSTAQTIAGWATGMDDGDADFSQSLAFDVTVTSGPELFTVPPSINPATGTLAYTPSGTSGTAVVSVTITDDDTAGGAALTSAAQTFTITIQHAPEIAVFDGESTAPADERTNNLGIAEFGNVTWNDGSFGAKIFTIQNVGNASLTGLALNVSGTDAADFTVFGLNETILAPNATAWFVVYFTPGASGVRNASVQISSNDANENPFGIVVRGTGYVAPKIAIEEPVGTTREGSRVFAWGDGSSGQTTVPAGLNGVVAVAGGASHSLVLTSAGKVVAWGGNGSGQATVPADLAGVTGIAAGVSHSVAVDGDGRVVAWGDDSAGQVTVPPEAQAGVTAVAAGQHHTLALKSNGSVIAWGDNGYGQTSVPLGAQSGVTAVAANNFHSLALKSDGTVIAWGANYNDQTNVPAGLTGVVAIAAGAQHSLALKSNGTVVIWGRDLWGSPFSTPAGLTDVVGITAGSGSSFALKGDGSVVGWTMYGEMGMPGEVAGVALISAGWNHTITVTAGRVDFGSRETGTTSPARTFTIKSTGLGALSISGVTVSGEDAGDFTVNTSGMSANLVPETGETTFSVSFTPGAAGQRRALLHVLSDDPDVRSFDILLAGSGYFLAPEMSITEAGGVPLLRSSTVTVWNSGTYQTTEISDPEGFIAVSAGEGDHYLALKSDGTVMAWGNNSYQQTDVPAGLAGVVAVAAGGNHSLALKSDGTVAAWGYGSGQLPPGLTNVTAVAAGFQHSLALKSDGTVVAWGDLAGVQPAGLTGVVAIAAGQAQSLALKSNGTVVSWGDYFSQSHVPPAGLSGVAAISARYDLNMALKHDGTVVAWGGQPWSVPVVPAGLNGVTAIWAGSTNPTFARKSDGSLVAWNRSGQLQYLPFDQSHIVEIANGDMQTLLRQGAASTFEDRPVGSVSAPKTFTIQNTGTGALSITGVTVLGAHAADFTVDTAGRAASVPAAIGATAFSVSFTPAGAGLRQAILRVRTNDPAGSFLIALSGSGLAPQIAVEQPAGTVLAHQDTRAFPDTAVGASHLMEFTVRNTGNAALNISNAGVFSFTFDNAFSLAVPPASVVPAGASTTLTVRFQPAYDGPHDAKLFIAGNDIEGGVIEINLTGQATAPKLVVQTWPQQTAILNNDTMDFQDVKVHEIATREIQITNTGEAPLNVGSVSVFSPDYMVTSFPSFNFVIQPDESRLVSIAFQPSMSETRTGALYIISDDPDVPYLTVNLTGRGIDNTPPVITSNGGGAIAAISTAENTTGVAVVQASDPEVPSTQALAFSKTGPDAALFSLDPVTGVLNFATPPDYEAAADADGDNVYHVTVTVADNAVPPASASQAFVISVTNVNEAPSIQAPASLAINEDAATGVLAFSATDPDAGAVLTVTAVSSNPTLVPANAIVLAGGGAFRSVTVAPVADRNGSALITLAVSDGSFTASSSFTLTVNAVNDAPTFALPPGGAQGYALGVAAGSGAYSASGFATTILPGPPDESSQTVSFVVAADNLALFAVQPAISADGTLTFTPGAMIGSTTVTVAAKDNGGTAGGGTDTSLAKSFVINLAGVPVLASALSENVTATGATLGGEVTSDGNSTVTERGVVLSPSMMNPNPQLGGFGVVTLTSAGTTGAFTVNAGSLTPGTAYSFAAYAKNAQGTGYTSIGTFSTPSNNADLTYLALINLSGPGGTYIGPSFGVLSPAFISSTTSYTASVPSLFNSTSINVGIAQADQTVTVNGVPVTGLSTFSGAVSAPVSLVTGPNIINTVVTAQDGTTKTYTITVTRTEPPTVTSPTVADITTTGATLGGNITSIGFATLMDSGIVLAPTATNSNPQLNGAGVIKIPGGFGTGVFTVSATGLTPGVQYSFAAFATNDSEPGSTGYSPVSTFTTMSNDASLSGLVLSSGTLSPSFDSGTTLYMASVSNLTETLTVTPTAQANATIRVNNVIVTSGSPSLPIPLVPGGNPVSIAVTAQDGFTSQTYSVNVTRLAPPTLGTPVPSDFFGLGTAVRCGVTSDGGAPVSQRGFVYAITSTNGTPRIDGTGVTKVSDGLVGTAEIAYVLFGLTPGTSYSFAGYATNSEGTTYSTTGTFTTLAEPPTVAGVSPAEGITAGGTAVTITGTKFMGATAVTFEGAAAASFTVVNATTITATTPPHAAGAVSVLVTTPSGTNAANTLYTYIASPAITGISPAGGSTTGGRSVTITGAGFTGTTVVTFGGTNAASFTVDSATQITATTPAHPAGAVSVEVTTAGGTNATNTLFTYLVPPTVTRDAISVVVAEGGTALNSGSFTNAETVTASVGTVTQATTWTYEGAMAQGAGSGPIELALDSAENLYVAAEAVNKIFKYDSAGALLTSWTVTGAPCGVAVDSANGWVYATSKNGNRVDKFTVDGDFLLSWGSTGTGNSQFNSPHCVAVDAAGAVYVSDSANNAIKVFTSAGVYLRRWGTGGSGNGQFSFNQGIRITPGGTVYVADRNNHRIQYFDTNGTFLGKFGTFGSGNGQFSNPAGVGIDPGGNVTVGDLNNHRIQRFSAAGTFIDKLGQATGTPAGNLVFPHGTAFPPSGRSVYVADWANGRVVKFGTPGGWNWTHPTTDGPSQNQTVTITATDGGGISATTTFSLTVENMAPTVAISAPASASEDASVDFAFTATDPSSMDQAAGFSWSLDYGDGTGVQPASAGTASPLARTHAFVNPGTYTVTATATDKDGGVSGNATAVVTILPAAPTVTGISPATGSTAGGASVTITGTGFTGATGVTIGGAAAAIFTVVNDTTITAVTPAGSTGSASVVVTTPGGSNAANTLFAYAEPPTVSTPTSAIITATGAVLGGDVSSDGNSTVTERGVVLSPSMMNPSPHLEGFGVVALTSPGATGVFTVNAESLTPGTAYSFAAYATNSLGTSYSVVGTFSTPSNNADLAGLGLINLSGPGGTYIGPAFGILSPAFSSGIASYTTSVPGMFDSTSINVLIGQMNQSVTVNGVPVTGLYTFSAGASVPVFLTNGPNDIGIVVTAQDGTTKTYTITVTRTAPPTVTSPTVAGITTTSATLGAIITSTGFTTLMEQGAVISRTDMNDTPRIDGGGGVRKLTNVAIFPDHFEVSADALMPGVAYSYACFATNAEGTSYTSTGTFTTISNDARLSTVALSTGTLNPAFSPEILNHQATVPNAAESLTVTPTAMQPTSTIRVNNLVVPSGSASQSLPLVVGLNTITIHVAAQDGMTTRQYNLTITREAAKPEIAVRGNGVDILDGDSTPTEADHTDYGSSTTTGGTVARTFQIHNEGGQNLMFSAVMISGAHAGDFTVTPSIAYPVAGGASTPLEITFNPGGNGLRTAEVSFLTNDEDENPFSFSIEGTGLNSEPTDILLSNASIEETNAADATVGLLSATDVDTADTSTFSLVSGEGSTDNEAFSIAGNALMLVGVADFEMKISYSVRIGVDDGEGGTFEKQFTITVTDMAERPVLANPSSTGVTAVAATLGGSVSSDGGVSITERGVVYSLTASNADPLIDGPGVRKVTTSGGVGEFSVPVTKLRAGIAYSFKAYAINSAGAAYTDVAAFTTQANHTPVVTVDGAYAFSTTGDPAQPRAGHTATTLADGRVLIVGGDTGAGVTATAELYDPATGTWSPAGSLVTPRRAHTASLLPDGRVLVVGGTNGPALNTVEIYDPETDIWSPASSLSNERYWHTASVLQDGRVLVVGGVSNTGFASPELYDPVTGAWTSAGLMQVPQTYKHTASVLPDGTVLVTGGSSGMFSNAVSTVMLYQPAFNSWSDKNSMPAGRVGHTASVLPNGKVLVAGGAQSEMGSPTTLLDADLYDPVTQTWAPAGSLMAGRNAHTASVLAGGKVLVSGGLLSGWGGAELYDSTSNSWTTVLLGGVARDEGTASVLADGRLLFVGGRAGAVSMVTAAELYAPEPQTVAEGAQATRTGLFSDGDGNATVVLTASTGSITQDNAAGTWTWSAAAGDGPATSSVTITATDAASVTTSTQFAFAVANAPPVVTISGPATALQGVSVQFTITATDPSSEDQAAGFKWHLSYSDGTSEIVTDGTASPLVRSHAFATAGDHFVYVVAFDREGANSWGSATKYITVESMTNANLASLTLGAGTLSPAFAANTTSYTAAVPHATTSLNFTATKEDSQATLSGSGSPLNLTVGDNTLTLVVTAQDGVTQKTYTVTVNRQSLAYAAVEQWAADNHLPPGDSGPMADADGDGVPNFLEFAFGTSPNVGSSAPVQMTGTFAGGVTMTQTGQPSTAHESTPAGTDIRAIFVRRADHAAVGVTYTVRFSADLITWQTSTVTPTVLGTDGIYQVVSVPYPLLIGGKEARFFTVGVDAAP